VEGSGSRPSLKPDPIAFCSSCLEQEADEEGSPAQRIAEFLCIYEQSKHILSASSIPAVVDPL
jgi:hypothetical protein